MTGRASTDGFRVRRATTRDSAGVWPLTQLLATSFVPARAAFDVSFAELVASEAALIAVAETADPAIVGYVSATCHPTLFANGPVAWVEEVIVGPEIRRRGAGTALIAEVERWASDRGAAYVSLATRRAAPFYTALGYEPSATFFRKTLDSP